MLKVAPGTVLDWVNLLSQIPGVALVNIGGEQKPAVRVQVDPAKIAALGLSLEDVRSALEAATVNAPKGSFDGPQQSFAIYDNDQLLKADAYNDVIQDVMMATAEAVSAFEGLSVNLVARAVSLGITAGNYRLAQDEARKRYAGLGGEG